MRERGFSTFLAAGAALVLGVVVGCQVPPGPDLVKDNPNASMCPNGHALGNFQTAGNVSASFSNNNGITTYFFASLTNENSTDGVPGLIKYCVYPDPAAEPTAIAVQAKGANGDDWTSGAGPTAFSFGRPNGDPSNIPLDGSNSNGTSTVMGTATWGQVPTDQTILLHINDPTICADLYGDDPGTCFVLPGQALACIVDHGATDVAYNAIPFGAADCPGHSWGFEAYSTNEFGDEVQLAANTGRDPGSVSLKVLFSSYACTGGHWYDGTCTTTPGATYLDLPITANIYAVNDCSGTPCKGDLLATVTQTFTVPYRPSADNIRCTLPDDQGKWFNPVAGICKNSISIVLTFTNFVIQPNAPANLPENVIWTVAYNTTNHGLAPIGPKPCSSDPGGCFYDSFNVGVESFLNAPYAGIDVAENATFLNSTFAGFYCDNGAGGTGVLRLDAGCWTGFRPLGEIITQ